MLQTEVTSQAQKRAFLKESSFKFLFVCSPRLGGGVGIQSTEPFVGILWWMGGMPAVTFFLSVTAKDFHRLSGSWLYAVPCQKAKNHFLTSSFVCRKVEKAPVGWRRETRIILSSTSSLDTRQLICRKEGQPSCSNRGKPVLPIAKQ